MARSEATIDDIIDSAVQRVTDRILPMIQRALAEASARTPAAAAGRRPGRARRRRSAQDLTHWVADRRARRVPIFVIQMTGLDTKKKIVARYGEDAAFDKGKPPPPLKPAERGAHAPARDAGPREVKARPPVVRKAAAR